MKEIVKQFSQTRNKVLRRLYRTVSAPKQQERAYQAAVKKYAVNLPDISSEDVNLVQTVKSQGVVITSLDALGIPSSNQIFEQAKNLIQQIPKSVTGKKDEYVVHANYQQMMENHEIFLWGLEQRILNIAEHYFGLPVAYHGAHLRRDIANHVEQKSRLWHIDIEDLRVLKVIVYLHDINEDNGPFEYIPDFMTKQVVKRLGYKNGYVPSQRMQQVLHPSHYQSCTGVAGTVVFAATGSIFHRGRIPVASDRYALFFDYTSRLPKYPLDSYSLSQEDLISLSRKISEYQRQSLLWQEHVFQ